MAESEQERAIREKLEEAQRLYQAGFIEAAEKRGAIKDAGEQFLKNLLGMGTETGGQNGVSVEFPSELRRRLSGASVQIPTEITTDAVPVTPKLVPAPVTLMPPQVTAPVTSQVTAPVTIQTAVTNTTTDGLNTGTVTANNKNAPFPSLLGNNAAYSSLLGQGEYAGPSTGMNRFVQILERMAVPGKSPAQAFAEGNLSLSAQEAAAAKSYLDRGLIQQKLQAQAAQRAEDVQFRGKEFEATQEFRKQSRLDKKLQGQKLPLTAQGLKSVASAIQSMIEGKENSILNEFFDKRDSNWFLRKFGAGMNADEVGEALAPDVVSIFNQAVSKGAPITIGQAVEQFISGESSAKPNSGIATRKIGSIKSAVVH